MFRLTTAVVEFNQAKDLDDIVEFSSEFLESYAPNWYNLFVEYDDIYKLCLHYDGKLYSLPNITLEESTYALRDLNIINATWLDEVGMDMPTTVDEFTDYLRAIKNAAGTGSIPANVIPLKVRNNENINGWYPILDWFGVYQGFASEYIKDGKACTNMGNPAVKAPLQYIAQLYSEGLIPENFTSYKWADYLDIYTKVEKGTPDVAATFTYDVPASEDYACFAPLKVDDETPSYSHDFSLESRIIDNAFAIFSNTKYPVAIIRAIDQYAGGTNAVRARYGAEGAEGVGYWRWEDDVQVLNTTLNFEMPESAKGWNDFGPNIISEEIAKALYSDEAQGNTRTYWYYELYEDTLPTDMFKFPEVALGYLTADERQEFDALGKRASAVNRTYVTKWITGKSNINDDWDDYVAMLNDNGLDERMDLMQKAYDRYLEAAIG